MGFVSGTCPFLTVWFRAHRRRSFNPCRMPVLRGDLRANAVAARSRCEVTQLTAASEPAPTCTRSQARRMARHPEPRLTYGSTPSGCYQLGCRRRIPTRRGGGGASPWPTRPASARARHAPAWAFTMQAAAPPDCSPPARLGSGNGSHDEPSHGWQQTWSVPGSCTCLWPVVGSVVSAGLLYLPVSHHQHCPPSHATATALVYTAVSTSASGLSPASAGDCQGTQSPPPTPNDLELRSSIQHGRLMREFGRTAGFLSNALDGGTWSGSTGLVDDRDGCHTHRSTVSHAMLSGYAPFKHVYRSCCIRIAPFRRVYHSVVAYAALSCVIHSAMFFLHHAPYLWHWVRLSNGTFEYSGTLST